MTAINEEYKTMKTLYIVALNNTTDGQKIVSIRTRAHRLFKDLKKYANTNTYYIAKTYQDAINTINAWDDELMTGRV